jgi:hypothetical protein
MNTSVLTIIKTSLCTKRSLKILVLLFSLIASISLAKANPLKTPIIVKYGIYIKRITVDFKEAKFHTEFYWWALFKNDSSVTGYKNDDILNLEYVNGINNEIGGVKNEIQLVKDLGNNNFYYTGFHQGDFYFSPNFKKYPFDKQQLDIIVENSLIPEEDLVFNIDSTSYLKSNQNRKFWGLSTDVISVNVLEGYKIFKTDLFVGNSIYNSNFGDSSLPYKSNYGRITTSIFIDRSLLPYISKLFIPLIIILFLVYFVFYLPTHKIEMSASLSVSAIFCATAFQLAISHSLPEIGYIIYVDKIFYSCYALIALSLTQSLITFYLDSSGEEKKKRQAKRLDMIFRFMFPILFIAALILFAL